ncbi:polysaccharide pyruvyl transferase family protein [Puniceicoccaceae bacterium K14]|nr:polysaccharide pyruvyl transferase family protein [Puniceicoccaceae bacterium K14]
MKIGIITLSTRRDNYGGTLQCYALQAFLQKMGHDAFLIRYTPRSWKLSLKKRIKALRSKIKAESVDDSKWIEQRKFEEFIELNIPSTKVLYSKYKDFSTYPLDADVFITGSDQVWNWKTYDSTGYPWFLRFGNSGVKRISYAASFGTAQAEKGFLNYIRPLLSGIDHVSVREKEGVDICKAVGVESSLVCDPTLLLNKDDYIALAKENGGSIDASEKTLCYLVGWKSGLPIEKVKKFGEENSDGIMFFPTQGSPHVFENPAFPTVAGWLEAYSSCKYVMTNSFHGTIFAILMQKQFITFGLSGRSSKMNSRVVTLLVQLGLEDRLWVEDNCSISEIAEKPINWEAVMSKLEDYRDDSVAFLSQCGL